MRTTRTLLLLLVSLPLVAQKKPVTIETLARLASEAAGPTEITWSPDGHRFAYKQGGAIWLYDVASRQKRELVTLKALEKAAAKPASSQTAEPNNWENRNVREQTLQWFASGGALLLVAGGDLFTFRVDAGGWSQLTSTPEAERDPKVSPDGRLVSFRRANDLYVLDLRSRSVTRLTQDGSETLWNAKPDWVYPEELDLGTAHWWSPDSKSIGYLQFDVSRQPLYPHADLVPARPVFEPQRYPKAGDPNADVRLGVVPASGGRTRWMSLGDSRDALLARVRWTPDSQALFVQRMNRVQNRLDLLRADARTGESSRVLHEEDPCWINLSVEPGFGAGSAAADLDDLRFLRRGNEFLWASERDGFRHLYRYAIDGRLLGRLTSGEWQVTAVAGVDEPHGLVYFISTEQSPLERHLYSAKLDGSNFTRITRETGTHGISLSPACDYYVDRFSSLSTAPRRVVYRIDGSAWDEFASAARRLLDEYEILPTEIVEVKAADGTPLYARLIKPAGFRTGVKYPAVVEVYGGPGVQTVTRSWRTVDVDQVLAARGFVVWQLDNRGSAGRGHRFESAIFRKLGQAEVEDQKEGIRHLIGMGFVDPVRIGVHGASYGGYMTLNLLFHAPDLFRAGAAVAPVANWRNYDSIYTERYMGMPWENEDGYWRGSPVHHARNLKAQLLLVHDFEDDNVLFQNTMQMAAALQEAAKPFEMMLYPDKSHGPSGESGKHMHESIVSFFERALK